MEAALFMYVCIKVTSCDYLRSLHVLIIAFNTYRGELVLFNGSQKTNHMFLHILKSDQFPLPERFILTRENLITDRFLLFIQRRQQFIALASALLLRIKHGLIYALK